MSQDGKLRLYVGPRNSYKEYSIIRVIKQLQLQFGNAILTHNCQSIDNNIPSIRCTKLLQYKHIYEAFNVIGILNAETYPDLEEFYQLYKDKQLLIGYTQIYPDNDKSSIFKLLQQNSDEIKQLSGLCEECGVDIMHTFEINSQPVDLCHKCYENKISRNNMT